MILCKNYSLKGNPSNCLLNLCSTGIFFDRYACYFLSGSMLCIKVFVCLSFSSQFERASTEGSICTVFRFFLFSLPYLFSSRQFGVMGVKKNLVFLSYSC